MNKLFILFFLFVNTTNGQNPYKKLVPGKLSVGFTTFYLYDSLRPAIREQLVKDKGRAMQVNIWYPSEKTTAPPMNFNDYVALISSEYNFLERDSLKALTDYFDWTIKDGSATKELIEFKKNGLVMKATRNAPQLKEKFPVVLLMHGKAADFAFLGEFLAGNGYIGVHTPYKGYLQAELDVDVTGMDSQVNDYEFALSAIKTKMYADFENVSVLGVSFGGQSAVAYTLTNPAKAVVSYDGGIGSEFGAWLLTRTKEYKPVKIRVPLLHLFNPRDEYTKLTAIKAYRYCDKTLIGMKNMEHAHFSSWGCLDAFIPKAIGDIRPGLSYEAVMQQTLIFLNFHQKDIKEKVPDWCRNMQQSYDHLQKT